MKSSELFTLPESLAVFRRYFSADLPPWEWVKQIGPALAAHAFGTKSPKAPPGVHMEGSVHIDASVVLPGHATIIGPVWIGAGSQIRPGAFIRGNVIAGEGCVLGNSCEFKNSLLLDGVQAAHFNYVGDSVLGNEAHLGAGAVCSNLRLDQKEVFVQLASGPVGTGLTKLGAILGDGAEVGCNAVLNPGSILGKRSMVMPAISFAGVLPAASIARVRHPVTVVPRRN